MTDLELVQVLRCYVSTAEMLEMSRKCWDVVKEAADRLEALNAEQQKFLREISKSHEVINSLLPKVWEWVPVDEKPEKYKTVFLWVKINGGRIAGMMQGHYIGSGQWHIDDDYISKVAEITHWAEIPAGPREG